MSLANWNKNQILQFTIDPDKIDEPLENYPILLNISKTSGTNNYDCSDVFNKLTTSGISFFEDFSNSDQQWQLQSGNYYFNNGYMEFLDPGSARTIKPYYCGENFITEFDFMQKGRGSGDDQMEMYFIYDITVTKCLKLYLSTYASSDYALYIYSGDDLVHTNKKFNYYNEVGTWYSTKIMYFNGILHFKVWHKNNAEPLTWDWEGTITNTPATTGYFYLSATTGNGGCGIDNIKVTPYNTNNKKIAVVYPSAQTHTIYEYDDYTKLLIQSNTFDGDTTFTDSSKFKHTITTHGGAKHSITNAKFGTSALWPERVSSNDSGYISINACSAFNFSNGNFTIDFWMYPLNLSENPFLCGQRDYNNGDDLNCSIYLGYISSDKDRLLEFRYSTSNIGSTVVSTKGSITENQWSHIALVRSGTNIFVFINGSKVYTYNIGTVALYSSTTTFDIGALYVETTGAVWGGFTGYIDEFRVSKSIARWTEDFTPPSTSYKKSSYFVEYRNTKQTQLYCEIENWDLFNKSAQLWVNVPKILNDQPTDLFFYYDETQEDNTAYIGDTSSWPAQQVWDENFVAVYHMAQDPSKTAPQILDSTNNAKHGTTHGNMTNSDLIEGSTGKIISFDGVDDYISIPTNTLNNPTAVSVEVAATMHDEDTEYRLFAYNDNNCYLLLRINPSSAGEVEFLASSGSTNYTVTTSTNTTDYSTYVITAIAGGQVEGFINGISKGSIDIPSFGSVNTPGRNIGASRAPDTYALTNIQEVRISNIARSAAWIAQTNLSLRDKLCTIQKANIYQISGYITELNEPVERNIYLYERTSGNLMDKTKSSSTGYYMLKTTSSGLHNLMCIDADNGPNFNDIILNKVRPELLI